MIPYIPFSPGWWAHLAGSSGQGSSEPAPASPDLREMPLVQSVIDNCPRRSRYFNHTTDIWNSLIRQRFIKQHTPGVYRMQSHIHVTNRNPGPHDDFSSGYHVGFEWYNTVNNYKFVCIDSTIGAAKWPSSSQYPYDSTAPSSPGSSPDRYVTAGELGIDGSGAVPGSNQLKRRDDVTTSSYVTIDEVYGTQGLLGVYTIKNTGGANNIDHEFRLTDAFGVTITPTTAIAPNDFWSVDLNHYEISILRRPYVYARLRVQISGAATTYQFARCYSGITSDVTPA